MTLLEVGHQALLARIHHIRQAQKSINIQTFIWSNDEVGRLMMYELIKAAKRGVKVRVLADQMFSSQDPGVEIYRYMHFLAQSARFTKLLEFQTKPRMQAIKRSARSGT